MHWGKIQTSKKFPSDKINISKHALFCSCELQLITVLLLICDSCLNWSTRLISLKMCVEFSIFDSASFLLKFMFLFNKKHWLFSFLIITFKIKTVEKTSSFNSSTMIFRLQEEIANLIKSAWVGWSSPKTDPKTNFLNLENWSFEYFAFSQ